MRACGRPTLPACRYCRCAHSSSCEFDFCIRSNINSLVQRLWANVACFLFVPHVLYLFLFRFLDARLLSYLVTCHRLLQGQRLMMLFAHIHTLYPFLLPISVPHGAEGAAMLIWLRCFAVFCLLWHFAPSSTRSAYFTFAFVAWNFYILISLTVVVVAVSIVAIVQCRCLYFNDFLPWLRLNAPPHLRFHSFSVNPVDYFSGCLSPLVCLSAWMGGSCGYEPSMAVSYLRQSFAFVMLCYWPPTFSHRRLLVATATCRLCLRHECFAFYSVAAALVAATSGRVSWWCCCCFNW